MNPSNGAFLSPGEMALLARRQPPAKAGLSNGSINLELFLAHEDKILMIWLLWALDLAEC